MAIEALNLWHKHRFALVITDCHMPEMDGFELTQKIRLTRTK
jgi:two-component system sensor histidine kinase EvgS